MKLSLTTILIVLISFCAKSQTALDSSTITFGIKYGHALQVRQLVNIPEVNTAIATASLGVEDTSVAISVTVTKRQLIRVYSSLGDKPIGVVRSLNDALMVSLSDITDDYPEIAIEIWKIENGYLEQRAQLIEDGQKLNTTLQQSISDNN